MKKLSNLLILFILVLTTACGGGKTGKNGGENTGTCEENKVNKLEGGERYNLKNFEVKSIKSMKAGWMLNAKEKCRNVYVYLGNYEVELDSYVATPPRNKGEYLIQICFNGEYVPKDENLKDVITGNFVPTGGATNAGKPSVYVTIYEGGTGKGYNMTGSDSEGNGKLTMLTDNKVCGEVKLKGLKGFEMDASFVADIEKDAWNNQK